MKQTNTLIHCAAVRLAACGLATGLAAACAIGNSETAGAGVADDPTGSAPYALQLIEVGQYAINGDTPTVAWSPDGKRLALADQISYYTDQPLANPDQRTISIIDTAVTEPTPEGGERPAIRQVYSGFGYHPAWLDGSRLAFGVSTYESDDAIGIWVLDLGGRGQAQRVSNVSAYHVRPGAQAGQVIYWAGWPEAGGWRTLDVATGASGLLTEVESTSSWQPPAGAFVDQAPAIVGDLETGLAINGGYVADAVSGTQANASFPSMSMRGEGDLDTQVYPSLSPDGRFVVFFVDDGASRSMLLMRVEKVALDPVIEAAKADFLAQAAANTLTLLAGPDALPLEARGDFECYAESPQTAQQKVFSVQSGGNTYFGFEMVYAPDDPEFGTPYMVVHLFDASGRLVAEGRSAMGLYEYIEWTLPGDLGVC